MYHCTSHADIRVRITAPRSGGPSVFYQDRQLGIGETIDGRKVLGLCVEGCPKYVGHMSYHYDDEGELIAAMLSVGSAGWYFDAGTTMREIWASQEELDHALVGLGIVEGEK